MRQQSNLPTRAKKEYHYKGFGFLLREMISNAFHATLLNPNTKKINITLSIKYKSDNNGDLTDLAIEITDNGEGFTDKNYEYFSHLDVENQEKVNNHLGSKGQGRLTIIHFADKAQYVSTFQEEDNCYYKREFDYPDHSSDLLLFDPKKKNKIDKTDIQTVLTLFFVHKDKIHRASTFFKDKQTTEDIQQWLLNEFFPFFTSKEKDVNFILELNGIKEKIALQDTLESRSFNIQYKKKEYKFDLYLIPNDKQKVIIKCCARNLLVSWEGGVKNELSYPISIENKCADDIFIVSDIFDNEDLLDTTGDTIKYDENLFNDIQTKLTEILDKQYAVQIQQNKEKSTHSFNKFRETYISLSPFLLMTDVTETGYKALTTTEIIEKATKKKVDAEKKFWNKSEQEEYKPDNNLILSSLSIYIKHREGILHNYGKLLETRDDDGNLTKNSEDKIHELIFTRGETVDKGDLDSYYKHNLWLIDDKYAYFTSAISSKNGENLSDIYIYGDNGDDPHDIVIIELKHPNKAYNPGDFITQVQDYAKNFYVKGKGIRDKNIDTTKCRYNGYVIASRDDINKERIRIGGNPVDIPFLTNSYYIDSQFYPKNEIKNKIPMRIELYSYEDIEKIAKNRNKVFFELLKKPFAIH